MKSYNQNKVILAVGDGANDVSMITQAHVGIGIRGMEGSQACSASDFSIGQFKSLVPLLLAHGRECHRRNSYMVAYSFFKNFLFSMPLWMYGFYTWWSGQTFFDMYLLTFFNVFFTFMPVVLFAIFDWEMKLEELV